MCNICKCDISAKFPHEHIEGQEGKDLIKNYIDKVTTISQKWSCSGINVPWFRGQSDAAKSPLPKVLRIKRHKESGKYDEFWLSTTFRNRAPTFGETPPDRGEIDKWLFLMRHVELPTRLLDWTESALAGLYFAVNDQTKDTHPAVWMINPVALNNISLGFNPDLDESKLKSNPDCFPNTWVQGKPGTEYIRLAFKHSEECLCNYKVGDKPIAIQLTYCHPRMPAQKGCFTIHGTDTRSFEEIFDEKSKLCEKNYFKKFVINRNDVPKIYRELKTLGITTSTLYPDLYGLAKELEERFWYPDGS